MAEREERVDSSWSEQVFQRMQSLSNSAFEFYELSALLKRFASLMPASALKETRNTFFFNSWRKGKWKERTI